MIAGAGGAAHLAGVVAAKTLMPVLAVPIASTPLNGLDSLLAMVQMPKGIPVGTLAIGKPSGQRRAVCSCDSGLETIRRFYERLAAWRAAARPGSARAEAARFERCYRKSISVLDSAAVQASAIEPSCGGEFPASPAMPVSNSSRLDGSGSLEYRSRHCLPRRSPSP